MPYQHYGSALEHYLKHFNFQGPKLELSVGIKGLQVKRISKNFKLVEEFEVWSANPVGNADRVLRSAAHVHTRLSASRSGI